MQSNGGGETRLRRGGSAQQRTDSAMSRAYDVAITDCNLAACMYRAVCMQYEPECMQYMAISACTRYEPACGCNCVHEPAHYCSNGKLSP